LTKVIKLPSWKAWAQRPSGLIKREEVSASASVMLDNAGNTKGGSITVTSCLTSMDWSLLQINTKNFRCHTAYSKPVKQEVNSTVILTPLVFPG
jgi:hypothetical protein